MSLSVTALVAFVVCIVVLKMAIPIGKFVQLVDRPTRRKIHEGEIPIVGGIAMYITLCGIESLSPALTISTVVLTVASGFLLIVGVVDDIVDVKPLTKLLLQAVASAVVVIFGGYQIVSLGPLFTDYPILLSGVLSVGFSVFCMVGVINAVNMIDGVDCLAGGIVLISALGLLAASAIAPGCNAMDSGLVAIICANVAFLIFNSGLLGKKNKVFMGDSGSMFLGLMLAGYYISYSQGSDAYIKLVAAAWIFGLPLVDSLAVMLRRVVNGTSPFRAGRDHLHHLLLNTGLSPKNCTVVMLSLQFTCVLMGILGNYFELSAAIMAWTFLLIVIIRYSLVHHVIERWESLQKCTLQRARF